MTLSTEQIAVSTQRAQDAGLRTTSISELRDYRSLSERFDRIVSVGMFEHVGVNHYRTFFDKCATLLAGRRHAAAHDRPQRPAGGHQRLHPQVHLPRRLHPGAVGGDAGDRKAGLVVTDVEILRLHMPRR